jgi:magnesium chelatase accessory protein
MREGLSWEQDGADWPNRSASRFVEAAGLSWHVQQMGEGPVVLLVHGTASATHSWRDLAPLLARHFSVIALDLPGHGFTRPLEARRLSLPGMASAVADLLDSLGVAPDLAVGHSAGAAVLARMNIDSRLDTRGIVGLNAALLPFRGIAGQLFAPLAKLLTLNPLTPRLFAWGASTPVAVERVIRNTGSAIDDKGLGFYARLLRNPEHVASALGMMANWDLDQLERDLPKLTAPLFLVACSEDTAVPPAKAFEVRDAVPGTTVTYLRRLGHLAHEEKPAVVADVILRIARDLHDGTAGLQARSDS